MLYSLFTSHALFSLNLISTSSAKYGFRGLVAGKFANRNCWYKITVINGYLGAGCKENHFYSLPFGQAEASIY